MLRYSNFGYKFLADHESVYVITPKTIIHQSIRKIPLYTCPFQSTNVIVGFQNKQLALGYIEELKLPAECIESPLDRWKGISMMMSLPLVVVMNEYCELETKGMYGELYYFHKSLVQASLPIIK